MISKYFPTSFIFLSFAQIPMGSYVADLVSCVGARLGTDLEHLTSDIDESSINHILFLFQDGVEALTKLIQVSTIAFILVNGNITCLLPRSIAESQCTIHESSDNVPSSEKMKPSKSWISNQPPGLICLKASA